MRRLPAPLAAALALRHGLRAPRPPGDGNADAWGPLRSQINDISLEDYIAVKPKYAVYGACHARVTTETRLLRRAAALIMAAGACARRDAVTVAEP